MPDPILDAFDAVAKSYAAGELRDDAAVERALRERGVLDAPADALQSRIRSTVERFWDVVHEDPSQALGLATAAYVAANFRGANALIRAELRHRRGTALFALGRARESAIELEA